MEGKKELLNVIKYAKELITLDYEREMKTYNMTNIEDFIKDYNEKQEQLEKIKLIVNCWKFVKEE